MLLKIKCVVVKENTQVEQEGPGGPGAQGPKKKQKTDERFLQLVDSTPLTNNTLHLFQEDILILFIFKQAIVLQLFKCTNPLFGYFL